MSTIDEYWWISIICVLVALSIPVSVAFCEYHKIKFCGCCRRKIIEDTQTDPENKIIPTHVNIINPVPSPSLQL
jgi:uncharacterized membrane protein YccF (DUF307 family)